MVKKMKFEELEQFYKGRRVFITGHTGFKGSWLSLLLLMLGADVYGYALKAPTEPDLFSILRLPERMHHTIGDVRDFEALKKAYNAAEPDVVFHLAAQPIVRDSYKWPRETYETNVMGTVNLLETMRLYPTAESFLNVTTDKVYENNDLPMHAFREDEKLDGFDPYSNSKSCSELVTHSYRKAFFGNGASAGDTAAGMAGELPLQISTARAGNVIGGGDFANDRIIPDCVRDTITGKPVHVRNPYSTRPYQHVLEPLSVYMMIAMQQVREPGCAGCYNVGPDESDAITTGEIAGLFVKYWGGTATWISQAEKNAPHEASYLRLDCSRLKETFGWKPVWHVEEAVRAAVLWYKAWHEGQEMTSVTEQQIRDFFA